MVHETRGLSMTEAIYWIGKRILKKQGNSSMRAPIRCPLKHATQQQEKWTIREKLEM